MMDKQNGCIFWLKMMAYWKNIVLFGIKSALTLKRNLIESLSMIILFLKKTKIKPCGNEVTDFHDKENPKVDSNQFFLSLIILIHTLINYYYYYYYFYYYYY